MPTALDQNRGAIRQTGEAGNYARLFIGSLVPPAIALALDMTIFSHVSVWLLFQPAVIISAWIGGLRTAVLSSIASAVFVWCFVLVKFTHFDPSDGRHVVTTVAFIASGIVVGLLFDRLRGAKEVAVLAQDRTAKANVELNAALEERKRADEEMRRVAADLADAQRVGGIGSWYWDLRKPGEVAWSDEMYRLHGLSRDTFTPTVEKLAELFEFESEVALAAAIESVRTRGTPYEIELRTVESNKAARWIVARGEAVRGDDGTIIAIRGISQDITRLKDLQRVREEWMSVIGRELREPIGSIKMAAQLLPELHDGKMSERETSMTERVGAAATSLERMVTDLLDVSKLETASLSLKRDWVEPAKLIRETLAGMTDMTSHNRVLVKEEKAPERVFCDEGRLRQVLSHLVGNAVKHGRKGGDIVVFIRGRGSELEIVVSNHGSGIAPRDLSHLFTRFGRLEDARRSGVQGLGLGLYLAKGLVEAHGGRIWYESASNKATSFHFTIPMERTAEAAA